MPRKYKNKMVPRRSVLAVVRRELKREGLAPGRIDAVLENIKSKRPVEIKIPRPVVKQAEEILTKTQKNVVIMFTQNMRVVRAVSMETYESFRKCAERAREGKQNGGAGVGQPVVHS